MPRSSNSCVCDEERREVVEHRDRVGEQSVADEIGDGFENSAAELLDRQDVAAIGFGIDVALQDLPIPEQGAAVVALAAEDVGFGELGGEAFGRVAELLLSAREELEGFALVALEHGGAAQQVAACGA